MTKLQCIRIGTHNQTSREEPRTVFKTSHPLICCWYKIHWLAQKVLEKLIRVGTEDQLAQKTVVKELIHALVWTLCLRCHLHFCNCRIVHLVIECPLQLQLCRGSIAGRPRGTTRVASASYSQFSFASTVPT